MAEPSATELPLPVTVTFTETQAETPISQPDPEPESEPKKPELIEAEPQTEPIAKAPPISFSSFKEESNRVSDLTPPQRKALEDLKLLLHKPDFADASLWGVPLLDPNRSDSILLKFLRAREFNTKAASQMLADTICWRKGFGTDGLIEEDLDLDDLEKVVFMHGHDKEGHPVCYNVYGEFQDKVLYVKTFGDEERRRKFLRWRIRFLERSIRKLDFSPGGVCTIFQVNDLKNAPGPRWKELRIATKQALVVLQDNYPEFVVKQVFINVPWWYMAFYTMISPFLTQRTKSKFVFAGPSRTVETLYKYISPEKIPVQYGGLSVDQCECNPEFGMDDPATVITIKPGTKQTVEIQVYEKCTLVWELRVVGWEVTYSAEFVPDNKIAYTMVLQKSRKMAPFDEPVVSHSFKVSELGKLMLVIDNPTLKRKKLVYRFIVKPL